MLQEQTWKVFDRTDWPPGPWVDEPDKANWTDPATGLPCLAQRVAYTGIWCGYVGIPEGHPFHSERGRGLVVHGDVTYRGYSLDLPFELKEWWWLGFDCGHYGDHQPLNNYTFGEGSLYRDLAYVREQCALLARQLASEIMPNEDE